MNHLFSKLESNKPRQWENTNPFWILDLKTVNGLKQQYWSPDPNTAYISNDCFHVDSCDIFKSYDKQGNSYWPSVAQCQRTCHPTLSARVTLEDYGGSI